MRFSARTGPGAGEFVVAVPHLSIDPDARLDERAGASYIDPVESGAVCAPAPLDP